MKLPDSYLLTAILLLILAAGCKKQDETNNNQQPTERMNYITLKQDGVSIEIDSIHTSSTVIIPGVFKGVKIIFFDKSRNKYDFSLVDSSLNLDYVTPKRYQGFGNTFLYTNNGRIFSGFQSQSHFTCTKSDPVTKRFSGFFEILLLNPPNNNDTIRVTEGIIENIRLP